MTVREFMLKKFPTNKYMDCPVPQHHWETIQEYAEKYHEAMMKNLSSNPGLSDSCRFYEHDAMTAMNCIHCGKGKWMHGSGNLR